MSPYYFFKIIYSIGLLIIFVFCFGIKSIEQYAAGKYHMVREIVETEGGDIPAPSIAVLTVKKNTAVDFYRNEAEACLNKTNSMDCIENIGYKIEELLSKHSTYGRKWKRFYNIFGGWQYFGKGTLTMKEIGSDIPIALGVNDTKLKVYVYDQNEFLNYYSDIKMSELSTNSKSVFLKVHKIQKVNHCEASPTYSFSKCVENYIEKKIGCKLQSTKRDKHLEIQKPENLTACNASSFIKYSEYRSDLMLNSTSDIFHETHCLQNCKIFKYELAKKMDWSVDVGHPTLIFKWLNKELSLENEVLAYDGLTFVANFGGTLGLFVGFSFFMLWDLILPIFERCKLMFKLK